MRSTFALSVTCRELAGARAEREVALQRKLEQPLANGRRALRFHREDAMRNPGAERRPQQPGPLERGF